MKNELLLGDEAVGLAAIDAGIGGAFSYPGTPATEIFEFIAKATAGADGVSAMWSANEKVAYEEALGMSYAGKRAIVSMKHVGLNVAMDPFVNSALTGVNGGLVLVVADDPGMHSSQNEQDSRCLADFAQIPIFEPRDQQEAYDLTREAFEVSERMGLPVLVRLVTRLSHSRAVVQTPAERGRPREARPRQSKNDWTLIPSNARRRFRRLIDMQPKLLEYAEQSSANELKLGDKVGLITSGIAHNYVREALGDDHGHSILKISVYPIPVKLVRDLVNHCDEIYVIEEGYPFIEKSINGLLGVPGKLIRGKIEGTLSITGELTPDMIAAALGKDAKSTVEEAVIPGRPPSLCKGCPHIDTFNAMLEVTKDQTTTAMFSDIGCYTLGCLPPYEAVHSCVDMGASIAMAHGAAQAGLHPVLCSIGDSTFTHSGMTGLVGAAKANANMTVMLLDNATVAMTGGQATMLAGDALVDVVKGLGVDPDHVRILNPLPKNHAENVAIMNEEIEHRGLSVIIARRPCIQIKAPKKAEKKETAPATVQ